MTTTPDNTNDIFAGLTLAEEEELYLQTGKQFADFGLVQDAIMASAGYEALRDLSDAQLVRIATGEDTLEDENGEITPATDFLSVQISASYLGKKQKPAELASAVRSRLNSIREAAGNYSEFYGYVGFLLAKREGAVQSWEDYRDTHTFADVVNDLYGTRASQGHATEAVPAAAV